MLILYYIIAAAVWGLISIPLGEMVPRDKVREDVFPLRTCKWEKNGEIYKKIRIQSWKKAMPDLSRVFPGMVTKKVSCRDDSKAMDRLVKESCVAELVHLCLIMAVVPTILLIGGAYRFIFAVLYALGNLIFIVIQRYNRPRLIKLRDKMRVREAKLKTV